MLRIFMLSLAFVMSLAKANADEGMWTMHNLPSAVYERMKEYGFSLPQSAIYHDSLSIKNAVVSFCGYCTGAVVSPMGLVMTNHHCGFESIRRHSTVEHDYLLNGFSADSLQAELPCENAFVTFTIEQQDVTHMLAPGDIDSLKSFELSLKIDSLTALLDSTAKAKDSTLSVRIDPFYEGNAYYATTCRTYDDVRLVFTLPKSMGKFGGETDNWMWPRQTCDFSVFRVYVDPKTHGPAPYSKDNVPMTATKWLPVSTDGYKDGDFAMVIGTPGSTERYISSYGIQEMRDCVNDPMQQVRGVKQEVMKHYMALSDSVRIKYDSKFAQSSNYWKNSIGMNKCIDSIDIVGMKRRYEERIAEWQDTTTAPVAKLDMRVLERLYAKRHDAMRAFTIFAESFTRRSNCELAVRAMKYYNGMTVKGPEKKPRKQYVAFDDNSDQWDMATDKAILVTLLKNYREQVDKAYHPAFYERIDKEWGGDYSAFVDDMWQRSMLVKPGEKIPVRHTRRVRKDVGMQFGLDLVETLADLKLTIDEVSDSINEQERLLCRAKLLMEYDLPHYSDANLTMRMTYGQVGGYRIGGYDSGYYTTAPSIIAKMEQADMISDYKAEPVMHSILSASDFEEFTDSVSKSLNLCFLTNNDITGGNSGSPVIDGRGRLIGLAFDGNWDSLSSDINYDSTLARCISVDIRYVLYMMRHWGKAEHLVKEMIGE